MSERTALITGGGSGMGLALARLLVADGTRVVITGRDRERLDKAAAELGERAIAVPGDVADLADIDRLMTVVRDRAGHLDMVFANAGVASFQPMPEVTESEFDRVTGINFKGVYFTIQRALPLLADGASIVINASWTLHRGLDGGSLYSATKAAVHNLTRTLAAELAPRRIRVNSVSPGYIETPMYTANVSADTAASVVKGIPAGRIGSAEEVANVVRFLGSVESGYVNGQDLVVDGGLVAVAGQAL
ncbi:glucose 1-dehydrogenase [Pseudonocardiaceae bacterium YIM PH 21723]|nr:glucose 1-dehydrogenase [Pseudonocardiaceae bacterium YIM PH 21723]